MKVYIIRHGETPWNALFRLQGQTDIQLNETGRELAMKSAKGLSDVPFYCVFTSPLSRAKETAKLALGERADQIPFIEESRIGEISFGVMEGDTVPPEKRDDHNHPMYYFFREPDKYNRPENGESIDDVCIRTADFLNDIASREELKDKTILLSTHGCASRALLTYIDPVPRRNYWRDGVPKNCAVSIADYSDGKWTLLEKDKLFY